MDQISNSFNTIIADGKAITIAFIALVGAIATLLKSIQSFVDLMDKWFPGISKADHFIGVLLRGLLALTHWGPLNTAAMNPTLPHAMAAAPPEIAAKFSLPPKGYVTPLFALLGVALAGFLMTFGRLFVILCIVAAFGFNTGCTHAQMVNFENALAQCELPAVAAVAQTYFGDVGQLLTGQQPNWENGLTQLEAQQPTAVICAISHYANPPSGAAMSSAEAAYMPLPSQVRNAKYFLATHGQ